MKTIWNKKTWLFVGSKPFKTLSPVQPNQFEMRKHYLFFECIWNIETGFDIFNFYLRVVLFLLLLRLLVLLLVVVVEVVVVVRYTMIVIYKALCFDVAQGRMNWAPNETRTHSCRLASLAC